jgi:hypothetical protein
MASSKPSIRFASSPADICNLCSSVDSPGHSVIFADGLYETAASSVEAACLSAPVCRPLIEVRAAVPDFRKSQGKRHSRAAILALVGAARLCGDKSYGAIAAWGPHYGSDAAARPPQVRRGRRERRQRAEPVPMSRPVTPVEPGFRPPRQVVSPKTGQVREQTV